MLSIQTHESLGDAPMPTTIPIKWKALKKEIGHDTKKQEYIPWLWIGKNNIVNMAILPKKSTDLI